MKRKYSNKPLRLMVFDTETADLQGNVYDIGYTIADKQGNIFITRNWLVEEIFTNGKVMKGAFFASKIFNEYAVMLHDNTITLEKWRNIIGYMRQDFYDFNVNVLSAYNLPFDLKVTLATNERLGGNVPILPRCRKLDLYRFACMAKLNTKLYKQLATEQGWVSKAGNYRTTAECAFRYISGEWDFVEQHTALHDAIIETAIMKACFAAHSKIPYNDIRGDQWKIVNPRFA